MNNARAEQLIPEIWSISLRTEKLRCIRDFPRHWNCEMTPLSVEIGVGNIHPQFPRFLHVEFGVFHDRGCQTKENNFFRAKTKFLLIFELFDTRCCWIRKFKITKEFQNGKILFLESMDFLVWLT